MFRNFFEDMRRMQEEMNSLFNDFWSSGYDEGKLAFRKPLTDIKDEGDKLIARIELPGVKKEDIDLSITENTLEVKVEKKSRVKEEREDYFRAERSYKGFYRSFTLPQKIVGEEAEAKCENGVLKVVMPKKEKSKKKKKKKIKVK